MFTPIDTDLRQVEKKTGISESNVHNLSGRVEELSARLEALERQEHVNDDIISNPLFSSPDVSELFTFVARACVEKEQIMPTFLALGSLSEALCPLWFCASPDDESVFLRQDRLFCWLSSATLTAVRLRPVILLCESACALLVHARVGQGAALLMSLLI